MEGRSTLSILWSLTTACTTHNPKYEGLVPAPAPAKHLCAPHASVNGARAFGTFRYEISHSSLPTAPRDHVLSRSNCFFPYTLARLPLVLSPFDAQ